MTYKQDDIYKYQPLWENWYIDMPIGKGSFGSVYKISREDMGHKYTSAVKIISIPSDEQYKEAEASFGGDEVSLSGYFEDIVHNIINEINMLYTLKGNSNIVGYEDHKVLKKEDRVGWDILIRMEYVTALKKYIASHQMSKREVIKLGIDICSALELCSNRGIIHRDIKDDNIFVNQDGVFKLGDFGISKELSKSGRAASMRGTPLYMAPEVFRGDKYDAAVDIYSLGIVMYKLLNHGRMPFMPSYPETIRFKDSEAALDKRMSGSQLPLPDQAGEALGNVILKACAYQAGDRFAAPTEMKRELERVLSSLSDTAKDELVTMLNTKSQESASTNQSGLSGQPEQKEKTVSIFGAGLTEPISEPLDKPESKPEKSWIESAQTSAELPQRDLDKTESIFASKQEPPLPDADNPAFAAQPQKIAAGPKKPNKPTRAVIAAIAVIVVVALILAVEMNRIDKSTQLSSQLAQTATNATTTPADSQAPQTSTNITTTPSSSQPSQASSNTSPSPSQNPVNQNTYENIKKNIPNGGITAQQGDWIYYVNQSESRGIYKIRTDGTGDTKLNSDYITNDIVVIGNWIYYSNASDGVTLYKIQTDGTGRTKLNNDYSDYINVVGDWIYYMNGRDKCTLYKIQTDGTGRTKLNSDINSTFGKVNGDWIYYSNGSDNYYLYKIRTDGTEEIKLNSDISSEINIVDDWIYFRNGNDNNIYRIRTDGTDRQKVK